MINIKLKKTLLIYLAAWLIVIAAFWCGLKNDAMLFSGMMSIVAMVFSIIAGVKYAKLEQGKIKEWVFIAGLSVLNTAFSYLTFSLSNNLAFHKINMPDWDMLTMSLAFAFIGIMIGRTFPMKATTKEGKIETVIRAVAKVLGVIFIISMASAFILPAENNNLSQIAGIAGDYQAVEQDTGNDEDYVGGFWHLYIGIDDESGEPYFSIYDNAAGNPGVEGKIAEMGEEYMIVEYDPDYYDQLPSYKWQMEGKNLEIQYKKTLKGIELTNNGTTIQFIRDESDEE